MVGESSRGNVMSGYLKTGSTKARYYSPEWQSPSSSVQCPNTLIDSLQIVLFQPLKRVLYRSVCITLILIIDDDFWVTLLKPTLAYIKPEENPSALYNYVLK